MPGYARFGCSNPAQFKRFAKSKLIKFPKPCRHRPAFCRAPLYVITYELCFVFGVIFPVGRQFCISVPPVPISSAFPHAFRCFTASNAGAGFIPNLSRGNVAPLAWSASEIKFQPGSLSGCPGYNFHTFPLRRQFGGFVFGQLARFLVVVAVDGHQVFAVEY